MGHTNAASEYIQEKEKNRHESNSFRRESSGKAIIRHLSGKGLRSTKRDIGPGSKFDPTPGPATTGCAD
jgi:hypothetical protein